MEEDGEVMEVPAEDVQQPSETPEVKEDAAGEEEPMRKKSRKAKGEEARDAEDTDDGELIMVEEEEEEEEVNLVCVLACRRSDTCSSCSCRCTPFVYWLLRCCHCTRVCAHWRSSYSLS